ncbi:hypothetical protein CTAYLR_003422 [Chrysophaeum taylorii]|uniref:DUF899 domain-containing protein n=1 Tax=Chrysophaeum taylorii TaxID=2483200 RepID=A0AAD7XFV7_9STRA|nr:hypothetical protein CTAYLR_003422 [Chrysophaeum taylorii]
MEGHSVVAPDEWLQARRALLAHEKDFTRQRQNLAKARQDLPWVRVTKSYEFAAVDGARLSLADLFGSRSQLIVYHFMFGKTWTDGCKSCSFMADGFDGVEPHLRARDVSIVACSSAPPDKLDAYKRKLGWEFRWVSSLGDFNKDFHVTFEDAELPADYNFGTSKFHINEAPGFSVFYKDEKGNIFHTYSTYARGLENFLLTYQFLDIVPKGRDEAHLDYPMTWIRRKYEYDHSPS